MANQIVNAAPMVIDHGIQDLSTRQVPVEPIPVPQHLAKFFFFAKKGGTKPAIMTGPRLLSEYGEETFDFRSKFATHSTVFMQGVISEGSVVMAQRVIPDDAGPEANLTLYLDVLEAEVDLYETNSDGSIKLDPLGDPIVTGTTEGHKVKWVVEHAQTESELQAFGAATIKPGDQTDANTNAQSQRYPILQLKASSKGAYGNDTGIRLWAPTLKSVSAMPTKLMTGEKAYPYFISVIERATPVDVPKPMATIFNEQKTMVTFKPMSVDPLTDKEMYIEETFVDSYSNTTDARYPLVTGAFDKIKVYQENIDLLLTQFQAKEVPFLEVDSDMTASEEDKHLFNFVSGVNSNNEPYKSFVFVDSPDSIRLSEYTNVYAGGGSDGTMTNEELDKLVGREMDRYLDENDEVQQIARHVESHFYDSGFGKETKLKLANFIAHRHDTFLVLSTHESGERDLDASEEHSLAIALRTRLQMMPESEYFGTEVVRAAIVGRTYKLRNSQWKERTALTYEWLRKSARYMGAGNGRWTNGQDFSGAPGSIVEFGEDINISWVPAGVRNRNWDVGLNWVDAYDLHRYHIPAFKTIYSNDTSILTSYTNACAFGTINKILHAAHREFSGVDNLTNAQLVQRVNDFINDRVSGIFDNRFIIEPQALITDMDYLRGFSWTLPVLVRGNNMKTVMTAYAVAGRIDE